MTARAAASRESGDARPPVAGGRGRGRGRGVGSTSLLHVASRERLRQGIDVPDGSPNRAAQIVPPKRWPNCWPKCCPKLRRRGLDPNCAAQIVPPN